MSISEFLKFENNRQNILLLGLLSLLMVTPIYLFGIPNGNGNDLPQHYRFALIFLDSIKEGILYPSWGAPSNYGFGDIGIRFYPPFSYYVLIFFKTITGGWYEGSCLAFVFWFFLSGIGVYLWAKEYEFSNRASLIAGCAFIIMPFHVNELYNAFTYAEFAGSAILPFCFLFVTRVFKNGRFIDVIGLGISYGLLTLTHLPLTLIGSICLFLFSVFSFRKSNFILVLPKLSIGVVLGLLLSSFYWIRLVTEISLVNHNSSEFTSDIYDFHKNFALAYFYTSSEDRIAMQLGYVDRLLIYTILIFVPVLLFYIFAKKRIGFSKLSGIIGFLLFSIFITTELSMKFWEIIPILSKVQFPWRFLSLISLGGAICVASGFENILDSLRNNKRPLAILTFGLMLMGIVFTTTNVMRPFYQNPKEHFEPMINRLNNSVSYEYWWSIWSKKDALTKTDISRRSYNEISRNQKELIIKFDEGNPIKSHIKLFYYPHWKATVNDVPVTIEKDENGVILIPIPKEESVVKLYFEEPILIKTAFIISSLAWLGILFYFLQHLKILSKKSQTLVS